MANNALPACIAAPGSPANATLRVITVNAGPVLTAIRASFLDGSAQAKVRRAEEQRVLPCALAGLGWPAAQNCALNAVLRRCPPRLLQWAATVRSLPDTNPGSDSCFAPATSSAVLLPGDRRA